MEPLVNLPLKALMPSYRNNGDMVTCSSSDFKRVLYLLLVTVPVDEAWYLSTYPDVKKEFDAGHIASAAEHYRLSGYFEGRFPSKPQVDEDWYLKQYPDVKAGVAKGLTKSALDHFMGTGASEARLPRRMVVDAAWYTTTYPAAQQRIIRGESTDAQDDFERHGYRNGWMPAATPEPTGAASLRVGAIKK